MVRKYDKGKKLFSNPQDDPDYREPPLPCSTAGCPNGARYKVQRKIAIWDRRKAPRFKTDKWPKPNPIHVGHGPWLNLCGSCEQDNHRRESREYFQLMGLDTPAKRREWCRTVLERGILPREPVITREPGSDDE